MKIRPLPDLDLARIGPLTTEQKWKALRQMQMKRPPHSYSPTRQSMMDILNVSPGALGDVPRVPWQRIAEHIRKASKHEGEEKANLLVAQALYDFAEAEMLVGRRNDFYPLAIGLAGKVTYWLPAVVSLERRPTVLFVDPRATKKLTVSGRRFVLSAMHQRIRLEDPDFADVRLAIVQLDKLDGGDRVSRVYTDEGVDLYSFDELDVMVRETYDIWHAVLSERDEDTRRKAGGIRGTLV